MRPLAHRSGGVTVTDTTGLETRSPADIGYLPWLIQRVSALLLVVLITLHVAVQAYGYVTPYRWGIYGALLDLTLGLLLLHGFLGIRATLIESSLHDRLRAALIWSSSIIALGLFLLRVLGAS